MKKIISMLVLAILTSCTQPNVIILPNTSPAKEAVQSSNISKLEVNKPVITEVKPDIKVSDQPIKPVEKDTNLVVKINEYGITPVVEVTPTPQATPYYNSQPLSDQQPIKEQLKDYGELPIQTPTTPEEAEKYGIDFRNAPDGKYSGIGSSVNLNPYYRRVIPVKEGIYGGQIYLLFEDKFKIRPKSDLSEFYSLIGTDVSEVNKLLKEYRMKEIYSPDFYDTEEYSENNYQQTIKSSADTYVYNAKSLNAITVGEINMKEFIEKLRVIPYVRDANFQPNLRPSFD